MFLDVGEHTWTLETKIIEASITADKHRRRYSFTGAFGGVVAIHHGAVIVPLLQLLPLGW